MALNNSWRTIPRRALNRLLRDLHRVLSHQKGVLLCVDQSLPDVQKETILRAAEHYKPLMGGKLMITRSEPRSLKLKWNAMCSDTILLTGEYQNVQKQFPFNMIFCQGVDPCVDAMTAWGWHIALVRSAKPETGAIAEGHRAFGLLLKKLKSRGLDRCYVFGTGPSLELARRHQFLDGHRIVCNTIVRDRDLMKHLNPDIIVAGDALYHFSETEHARAFRQDLKARMREMDLTFCFPEWFAPSVRQEFTEFRERCIPMPVGAEVDFTRDLSEDFRLPGMGNILGLMLLPLACNLAKQVMLLGFDGRKPEDKWFWKNSDAHSYPLLVERMTQEYPAFYDKFVPRSNPFQYMADVHGDTLDMAMGNAEKAGWRFIMLCPTTSTALAKRPKSLLG